MGSRWSGCWGCQWVMTTKTNDLLVSVQVWLRGCRLWVAEQDWANDLHRHHTQTEQSWPAFNISRHINRNGHLLKRAILLQT